MKSTWVEPKLEMLNINMTQNFGQNGPGCDSFWISDAGHDMIEEGLEDAGITNPTDNQIGFAAFLLNLFQTKVGT